ncbi:MAG: F0F1 ATP synthase subunit gamma [Candidatus Daviesbacteria bacterium]|nr:F0F1 ATP synthase subunit gamma [Candidatus Daviesbacteria bacterium]
MSTVKQIREQLDASESLKLVAQAYTEISALKLEKIRSGIEKNRDFFQEITEVYHVVNTEASKLKLQLRPKKGTVSVLITSNQHFYGALEKELVKFFVLNTTKFATDRVVIGSTAKEFLQSFNYFHPYQQVILKTDIPTSEEMKSIVDKVSGYEQILIYYSRMHSILTQEPHVVDVVQKPPTFFLKSQASTISYIFEPELVEMLSFFEDQITMLLIEQTFLESELARAAARLTSMDQAQFAADDIILKIKQELARAKKSIENVNLLENIATMKAFHDRA